MKTIESFHQFLDNEIREEIKKNKKNSALNENTVTENDYAIGFGRYLIKKILTKLDVKPFDCLYNTLLNDDVAFAIGKAFKSNNRMLL